MKKRQKLLIFAGVSILVACIWCCAIGNLIRSTPWYKATATAQAGASATSASSRATEKAIPTSTKIPTLTQSPRPSPTDRPTTASNTPLPTWTLSPTPTATATATRLAVATQPLPTQPVKVAPTVVPTQRPAASPTAQPAPAAPCDCSMPDYDCSDFSTQREAQTCWNFCGGSAANNKWRLDGNDHDGRVCENRP